MRSFTLMRWPLRSPIFVGSCRAAIRLTLTVPASRGLRSSTMSAVMTFVMLAMGRGCPARWANSTEPSARSITMAFLALIRGADGLFGPSRAAGGARLGAATAASPTTAGGRATAATSLDGVVAVQPMRMAQSSGPRAEQVGFEQRLRA